MKKKETSKAVVPASRGLDAKRVKEGRIARVKEAVDKKKEEAARKQHEAKIAKEKQIAEAKKTVAITAGLLTSKGKCRKDVDDLIKIAEAIIGTWDDTNASTICESDIKKLEMNNPSFGVLSKRDGKIIYGFFGPTIIKKLVISLNSAVSRDKDKERSVSLIKKHFTLVPLHRKKEK